MEEMFEAMVQGDDGQDDLVAGVAIERASRYPGILPTLPSQISRPSVDYDMISQIVLEMCPGGSHSKLKTKLEQMSVEQWNFDDACSFWIEHLSTDACSASDVRERLRSAKLYT